MEHAEISHDVLLKGGLTTIFFKVLVAQKRFGGFVLLLLHFQLEVLHVWESDLDTSFGRSEVQKPFSSNWGSKTCHFDLMPIKHSLGRTTCQRAQVEVPRNATLIGTLVCCLDFGPCQRAFS